MRSSIRPNKEPQRKYKTLGFCVISGLVAASLTASIGCAYFPEESKARSGHMPELQEQYARSVPTCFSNEECSARWAAARQWVIDNCGSALVSDTDDLIDAGGRCRVTKTRTSANGYLIEIREGFNNPLVNGNAKTRQVDFNLYVKRAWPPVK